MAIKFVTNCYLTWFYVILCMIAIASFVAIQLDDSLHMLPKHVAGPLNKVYADMRRLTTGIRCEKCVFRRFCRCANMYLHKPR